MANDHFYACRIKLKRANFHLEHVKHVLGTLHAKRDLYGLTVWDDPQTGERVVQASFPKEQFVALSIIAGEAIHQARSVLDHVVWALPREGGRQKDRTSGFPIFSERDKYENRGRGMIKHLSPAAIAIIDRLQPIKPEPERLTEPLYILQDLWNIEKHRFLNFATIQMNTFQECYKYPDGRFVQGPILNRPIQAEDGAELGRFRPPADLTPEVNVYQMADVHTFRFENAGAATGHEVTELLSRLLSVVESIAQELIATVP